MAVLAALSSKITLHKLCFLMLYSEQAVSNWGQNWVLQRKVTSIVKSQEQTGCI